MSDKYENFGLGYSDYFICQVKKINTKNKNILLAKVNTLGCQMNVNDSEKILFILKNMGYDFTNDDENADLILFNTCCVRENPELKLFGKLGSIKKYKKIKKDIKIIICGCMMQQENAIKKIKKSYDFVDIIFGTFNINDFPRLLLENILNKKQVIAIKNNRDNLHEPHSIIKEKNKASINVIYGCNNFCSYCVVPYVRGPEISRPFIDILNQIKKLSDDGVNEILLLGQNVNSYGNDLKENKINFAELLKAICKIKNIEKIRFMTSHPKDLSDDLIDTISEEKKVCKELHLPIQSGSNKILKLMNRKYTRESYLELVKKIKNKILNINLTTDIIVGFPGETEDDFNDTLDIVNRVKFNNAFTFIYSKREGTPAAHMTNQIGREIIDKRFQKLLLVLRKHYIK
ncbi:MAG: tRNA (N6-isopentenyl adenosine(37)-C2)-methylthiotransferase MiaB [Clostridiales bacterium]|jgi:tRNA-2-methylthio-N6-dimethylallyladenosine synthase|nr:tRNA (N6-isopentenyl adenosine(37)-C2)-methylthiotransferase MiaB [Clostridiales bacterium]